MLQRLFDHVQNEHIQSRALVNYVTKEDPTPTLPASAGWWQRHLYRKERRRIRRRARTPEKLRIEFSDWVAIPWRDRPIEARLADLAHDIGATIKQNPAWSRDVLDTHGVRLDVHREVTDIACSAYDLYQLRVQLPSRPHGPVDNAVVHQAQNIYDDSHAALTQTWESLLDRVATLDSYRQHLDELAPVVDALDTIARFGDIEARADVTGLYTATARNELAADETRRLAEGVDAVRDTAQTAVNLLARDVEMLEQRPPELTRGAEDTPGTRR